MSIRILVPDGVPVDQAIAFFTDLVDAAPVVSTAPIDVRSSRSAIGAAAAVAWKIVVAAASVEGALQFSERLTRVGAVRRLLNGVKDVEQPCLLIVGDNPPLDLRKATTDEVMNLISRA